MSDVLSRAIKTFWQAAVAYVIASVTVLSAVLSGNNTWENAIITLCVGLVAAGLSAAWNGVISPILTSKETTEAVEDAVKSTGLSAVFDALGVDLADITVDGLKKIAENVGAALEDEDLKSDIIAKIKTALGTNSAETIDATGAESKETT